jgi:hypothetical protein
MEMLKLVKYFLTLEIILQKLRKKMENEITLGYRNSNVAD